MENTVVVQHIVVGVLFFVLYVKQGLSVLNGLSSHVWKCVLSCWHGAGSFCFLLMRCAFILSSLGNGRCMY